MSFSEVSITKMHYSVAPVGRANCLYSHIQAKGVITIQTI